jgi:aspartyl-tRNA(Asn)/glutamyl-tRNA(Gln) amidotransferase subunit A
VIGATAADAAALLQVLAGYDERDPTSSRMPVPDYTPGPVELPSLRLGVPGEGHLRGAEPEVIAAFSATLDRLRASGVELREVELPSPAQMREIHWVIVVSEAATLHLADYPDRIDGYGEPLRNVIAAGAETSAREYLAARWAREGLALTVTEALRGVDALALPTMPIAPPHVGQTEVEVWGRTEDATAAMISLTSVFNHTGHPAIALPAGEDERGLPFSLQLAGPHFEETRLLSLAATLEPLFATSRTDAAAT